MNICIILSSNPYFSSSASGNRWISLINGLISFGVNIELIVYDKIRSEKELAINGIKGQKNGISYLYLNPSVISGYLKSRFHVYLGSFLNEKNTINRIISSIKPESEIIWTDTNIIGLRVAVEVRKKFPQKVLFLEVSEFMDIHKFNKGNFLQRMVAERRREFFEKKSLWTYHGIAWMTKTLLSYYNTENKGNARFLHLPMTVDFARFSGKHELKDGFIKPYISFVGVMDNKKDGVNILIEAFSRLTRNFPSYRLYLVGSWNYDTPSHLKRIKDMGMEDRIIWCGELPRDAIPGIILNSDLLVLPRPDSKQARGGFPTKLGEYLATGNPVCATEVGEIPDYLKDNESVFFAKPGSIDSFYEAMLRALENPVVAKKIGEAGKDVARMEFNSENQTKKLIDFFEELLLKQSNYDKK